MASRTCHVSHERDVAVNLQTSPFARTIDTMPQMSVVHHLVAVFLNLATRLKYSRACRPSANHFASSTVANAFEAVDLTLPTLHPTQLSSHIVATFV